MADLFDGYEARSAWDEMLHPDGRSRSSAAPLVEQLQLLSTSDLDERAKVRDRTLRERGITFSWQGEERPFPLDLVPRIISAADWRQIDLGVRQRVRALEALLADLAGDMEVLDDGVLPRRLVMSSPAFERAAFGIRPANGVRIHVAGIDVVRDANGRFCVLEDNVRTPSGLSYVVENRRTMTHTMPELFATQRVRPVDDLPRRLLAALRAAAPARTGEPTIVVLTPGVYNAAYFEHAYLARQMGVELVEGRDLVCRNRTVWLRTTAGERRVDVVYRRIDDDFLDPLHFRADSVLGVAGILDAARAGNVTIANGVGNGVADDKAIYPFVPALIDYYLGEEPILPNVPTYRLEDRDVLADVLGRLDQLVVKPVDGSGGKGVVIGPKASDAELADLGRILARDPRGWIAQEVVTLSTAPTFLDGRLQARHVDLRPFAVNDGNDVWVVPGGLTRVALQSGNLIVNSSQGGGSKDTWIIADVESAGRPPASDRIPVRIPAVPDDREGVRHRRPPTDARAATAALRPPARRPGRGLADHGQAARQQQS